MNTQPVASPVDRALRAIEAVLGRKNIELIASRAFSPAAVMRAQGSPFTNKCAGYPRQALLRRLRAIDVISRPALPAG